MLCLIIASFPDLYDMFFSETQYRPMGVHEELLLKALSSESVKTLRDL